jgi:hypothetical protein
VRKPPNERADTRTPVDPYLALHRADDLGQQPATAFDLAIQYQHVRQRDRPVAETRTVAHDGFTGDIPVDACIGLDRSNGAGRVPSLACVQSDRRVHQSDVARTNGAPLERLVGSLASADPVPPIHRHECPGDGFVAA